MHVLGTAGHVDHGKSTLIEALTGVHPDRLKEEQIREMTIDLGFGWLTLQDGTEVGLVDVPGHIDFIGNLLSGVGGIDAVLFVIAADEGIMPQTREHAAILRLLKIPRGILVLTKIDLVSDENWLIYLKEEIRELFADSPLADAPIVSVSARSGEGLPALRAEIERMVQAIPAKPNYGRPRLPVDRVFQLQGIGTVVTGTLQDGELHVGDLVEILPGKLKGRIRELQIHRKKTSQVSPGNRTAVNISGISKHEMDRGNLLVLPETYQSTQRLDIEFDVLQGISRPITHNSKVRLYLGSKSVSARVRVIGVPQLQEGETGFLQLECDEPLVAVKGDRLILRRLSPGETLGGGTVLNAQPSGRHKRFAEEVLKEFNLLHQEDPAEVMEALLVAQGPLTQSSIAQRLNLTQQQTQTILTQMITNGLIFQLSEGRAAAQVEPLLVHQVYWQKKRCELLEWMAAFHDQYPLKPGASLLQLRDRFQSAASILPALLQSLLKEKQLLSLPNQLFCLPGFQIRLSPREQKVWDQMVEILSKTPHTPPGLRELASVAGESTLKAFLDGGLLIKVSDDLVYLPQQINQYEAWLRDYFLSHESLPLSDFKDHFQTSRKFALAVLEYFDRLHVTERDENVRKLVKNAPVRSK